MRFCDIPVRIQKALNEADISAGQAEEMSKKELFEFFCEWNGIINWDLWELARELRFA